MSHALVLPSPLLPARAYAPLADALRRRGWGAVVAAVPQAPRGPEPVLAAYREAVTAQRVDLVVAHSNAGRYAVAAGGARVVYLDAALPPQRGDSTPGSRGAARAPERPHRRRRPATPWTYWWPDHDIAAVVPDPAVLAGIRADEQRMPLAYFRSRLGAPDGWVAHPQAYLALGETYAEETAFSRAAGWPTTVLDGALHLHHLVDPDAVAAAVLDLAALLRAGSIRSAPGRGATTTG